MAEIELYAIEEETVELVSWLLNRQCELIPDCHYESSSVTRLSKRAAIQRLADSTPHFFVIRDEFVQSPLGVREVTTVDKHFFYVDPKTGGPTLQFFWGKQFIKEEREHLSATWLSCYGWYEDSVSRERKKPPKALLDLYSDFGHTVRAGRKKIRPGKREFWLSPRVEDLVRSGAVLVGLEGVPVEQILTSK